MSIACGRTERDDAVGGAGDSTRSGGQSSSSAGAGGAAGDALGGAGSGAALGGSSGGAAIGLGGSGGNGGREARGGMTSAGGSLACGALIDDMEDATGRICTGSGRIGAWYAFKDDGSTQWPSPTPAGTPIESSLIPGGRGESRRGIHTYGTAAGWGAGVGFDLNFDGESYGFYDTTRYAAIQFWARGTGSAVTFRLSTQSGTSVAYGGTCTQRLSESAAIGSACAGPAGPALKLGPDWVKYTVLLSELPSELPSELARATNVQFKIGDETRGTLFYPKFDFWIDDVSFVEGEPNCCPDLPACQGGVHFADSALRRSAMGSNDSSELLSCARVCSLRQLNGSGAGIHDLHGIECLSALDTLTLADNSIDDLSPLSTLTALRDVDLTRNPLRSLAGISGLHNLAVLRLGANQLENVDELAPLDHLAILDLSDNKLTSVSALAPLRSLDSLFLSGNALVDVKPLAGLALTTLDLAKNRVENAAPLAGLSQLKTLLLAHNKVNDLGGVLGLARLEWCDASDNDIGSLASVSGPSSVTTLVLSDNHISDPSALGSLTSLRDLSLRNNSISDASALTALNALITLDLAENTIRTLNSPFYFPVLRSLDLSSNGLTTPLPALDGMTFYNLNVSSNEIQSLEAFAGITLVSSGCSARNGAGCHPGLLDVSHNQVADLSPLLRHALGDAMVNLTDNPIVCADQRANIQALSAAGVVLNLDANCP